MFTHPQGLPGRTVHALTAACVVGIAAAAQARPTVAPPPAPRAAVQPLTAAEASELLRQLAADLEPTAAASRKVLLGRRDPRGPSCVRYPAAGSVRGYGKWMPMDPNGGPGTRFVAFCNVARPLPTEDYRWQQTQLRAMVERMLAESRAVSGRVRSLSGKADALAAGLRGWTSWQVGFHPVKAGMGGHWAGRCLASLNEAVGARDLAACRRWADELASAAFALADLHRWLEFVLENHCASLDFQSRCEELFAWAEQMHHAHDVKYSSRGSEDRFPAAAMILPATENLFEVERQAERLFQVSGAFLEGSANRPAVAAAVWMPPDLRGHFAALRGRLSPANQAAWDRAASMPFERSYLANMLFRISRAKALDRLAVVLERFDRAHRAAEAESLMDVIFYRGEPCGAVEWGDRFDPRLLLAAGGLTGSDQRILRRAHGLTYDVLGNWRNYKAGVWTLREVLDTQKLDCVRGTDMIGGLYRNAGRAGYCCIHLSCGLTSHNVAAAETHLNGQRAISIVDSLVARHGPQAWPGSYFRGFAWPEGYPGCKAPAFSAELSVRGLDNYVFAEGYILRGRNAGLLMRAAVPYLPRRQRPDLRKVYAGPYPKPLAVVGRAVEPAAGRAKG